MSNGQQFGVITEQGYVAGQGLGYTPTDLIPQNEDADNDEDQGA